MRSAGMASGAPSRKEWNGGMLSGDLLRDWLERYALLGSNAVESQLIMACSKLAACGGPRLRS